MNWDLRKQTCKDKVKITDVFTQVKTSGYSNCPVCKRKSKAKVYNNSKIKCFSVNCELNQCADIIDVYKIKFNIGFREAIEKLEEDFNINYEEIQNKTDARHELLTKILTIYKQNLWSKNNINAREYLYGRGFNEKTLKKFNIGYAPKNFILSKYINQNLLVENKFINSNGRDLYSNRIIFPLYNYHNRLVHFTGRSLDKNNPVRYLDSPSLDKYCNTKSLLCFENRIKNIEDDTLIITEGFPDSLIYNQLGIPAVGLLGLEKLLSHVDKLKSFENLIFAFDNDKFPDDHSKFPGEYKSWSKIIPQIYELQTILNSKNIFMFTVPPEEGKDSNEWIVNCNLNRQQVLDYIEFNKVDFVKFIIEQQAVDLSHHESILRIISSTNKGKDYFARFIPPEFTSLEYALNVIGK